MKWLAETHGIKFELVRHFLARMLDGEWSSMPGQWQNVLVGAFAMLLPAGMLLMQGPELPGPWAAGRAHQAAAPMAAELALLTLVFAVTGLIALIQWQNLFPGRRDYLSLAGLPIRSGQIFAARFGAVLVFSIALAAAMNILPSLMARDAAAQAAASGLGCFFVIFAIVALQGVLLNLLPAGWFTRISGYIQGLLTGVLLLAGFYSWSIRDWSSKTIDSLPQFAAWAPPVWFAGLYEHLRGNHDAFYAGMADRGLMAMAAAGLLMVLTYLLSYRRYRALLIEAPVQVEMPRRRQWNILRWLARNPRQEAAMQFMAATLARSRAHRMIWLAYIGAAIAVVLNSSVIDGEFLRRSDGKGLLELAAPWSNTLKFLVLFWPMASSVVLITGFRHVLSIPAELPANWIFRLTESQGRKAWMQAVERFVMLHAVAPIYVILFPVAVRTLGLPVALRQTVLQLVVSLILFEVLFQSWQQFPFTCSYVPGKRPLIAIVGGYIGALGVGVPAVSMIIHAASQFTGVFLFYFALFAGLWLYARRGRLQGWGEASLLYEDIPLGVPDLGIKEMSYTGWSPPPPPRRAAPPTRPARLPNQRVTLTLRAYRALAAAFPYEFKNAYGEELIQVTEESVENIWSRYGALGLVRLLADIVVRLFAEYAVELWQDIRYGLRMLAGSPGFTGVAVISLALGIGVATSAFSEMNGFVLRDVPGLRKPDQLGVLDTPVSFPDYRRYRAHTDLFSSTMAYVAPIPFGVSLAGHTERTWGHVVTSSYFVTLGAHPILGREFDARDDQPGREPSVVVSYTFWRNHLGSDPAVIGTALRINGQPCTIIGVGPENFQGASPMIYWADVWLPLSAAGRVVRELPANLLERHDQARFHMLGRLNPGVSVARAEVELDAARRQIEQEYGDFDRNQKRQRMRVLPGGKVMPVAKEQLAFMTGFFTLLGGMILLIAVANVANMTLARAAERRKEIAVRLALGASRLRLIRQLLTESMLVATTAGVVGLLMANWLMRLASHMKMPSAMPLTMHLEPDLRVLIFTIALTAFAALAFGLVPALQATRTDLTPALKEGGNIQIRRFRRLSLRNLLVVSQVSGSLALLLITGFLVIGHRRIADAEVGFDPRNLNLLSLDPLRDGYSGEQTAAFLARLLDRVRALPSVKAATLADNVPMEMIGRPAANFSFDGGGSKMISGARRFLVGRDFFVALGIPILRGRAFRQEDEANDSTAIIVNERVAQNCWPGQDPLGRRVEIGIPAEPDFVIGGAVHHKAPSLSVEARVGVVVGVVKNIRDGVDISARQLPGIIFLPLRPADMARQTLQGITLVVRAKPGVDAIGSVRREISALDDRITPFHARTMAEQIEDIMSSVRGALYTYGCIGIFGLILASVGLAGVTAYSVTQRRREIGIRMALGARRIDVLGLVMREGAVLVLIGSGIGFAAARAGTRALAGLMSDVARATDTSSSDPLLLVGAPLLLAILALVCCYVPARRSMRIDPAMTLRQE